MAGFPLVMSDEWSPACSSPSCSTVPLRFPSVALEEPAQDARVALPVQAARPTVLHIRPATILAERLRPVHPPAKRQCRDAPSPIVLSSTSSPIQCLIPVPHFSPVTPPTPTVQPAAAPVVPNGALPAGAFFVPIVVVPPPAVAATPPPEPFVSVDLDKTPPPSC